MKNQRDQVKIESWVRRKFPDMSNSEASLYYIALPCLERKKRGDYKAILATQDEWAEAGFLSRPSVSKGLKKLAQKGLISHKPGDNGLGDTKRKCGIVRRLDIHDIESSASPDQLSHFIPADLSNLAKRLDQVGVPFVNEMIYPEWNPTVTGRLSPSKCKIMTPPYNNKAERIKGFLEYANSKEEYLVECDWKQAEPTVLFHILNERQMISERITDIYSEIANTIGISREKAKKRYQPLIYGNGKTLAIPPEYHDNRFLCRIFDAIQQYREEVWTKGAPSKGENRHTHTLMGRKMRLPKKKRGHRGRMLSWHLQGTVADLFSKVLTVVLDDAEKGKCRFVFQAHDSIIVGIPRGQEYPLSEIMTNIPEDHHIKFNVKTTNYTTHGRPDKTNTKPPEW